MTESRPVFDEETDPNAVINTILLLRIYDVMMCIAREINPEEAYKVYEAHSQGKIFSPPPSFVMGEDVVMSDESDE